MANRLTQDAVEALVTGGSSNVRLTQVALEALVRVGVPEPPAPTPGSMATTPGTAPQIILQVSNDGGKTWSQDLPASIGPIGQFKRLVRWRKLGRSNNRAYRVIISDPVKVVLVACDLDAE